MDESGHGTLVDGWSCVFPMDNEIVDYAITLSCEKGGQRFVLRPRSVAVPAGYAVLPWDYEGTATGAAGIYFTTESRKHHCSFTETELGCDNFNFPDDLPPVRYMGQPQQPTAIVLEPQGSPRFEVYGDPTFTQYSDSGEWGADTRVLATVRSSGCAASAARRIPTAAWCAPMASTDSRSRPSGTPSTEGLPGSQLTVRGSVDLGVRDGEAGVGVLGILDLVDEGDGEVLGGDRIAGRGVEGHGVVAGAGAGRDLRGGESIVHGE